LSRRASSCDVDCSVSSITAAVVATVVQWSLHSFFVEEWFFAWRGHCTLVFQSLMTAEDSALCRRCAPHGVTSAMRKERMIQQFSTELMVHSCEERVLCNGSHCTSVFQSLTPEGSTLCRRCAWGCSRQCKTHHKQADAANEWQKPTFSNESLCPIIRRA